jgi:hypothetical protein
VSEDDDLATHGSLFDQTLRNRFHPGVIEGGDRIIDHDHVPGTDLVQLGEEARQSKRAFLSFAQDIAVFPNLLLGLQPNLNLALTNLTAVGKLQRQVLKVEGNNFVFEAGLQSSRQNLPSQARDMGGDTRDRTGRGTRLRLHEHSSKFRRGHESLDIGGEFFPRFQFVERLLTPQALGGLVRRWFERFNLLCKDGYLSQQLIDH